jgi:hypothetical protein
MGVLNVNFLNEGNLIQSPLLQRVNLFTSMRKLNTLWPKNSVAHILWVKAKTLIQLCCRTTEVVVFQGRWKVQFLVFLFLAWFVVLQVIVEWPWWAGFSDGVQSWLFNGYSLWAMWKLRTNLPLQRYIYGLD